MSKLLIRIVAVLLISCLVVDPTAADGLSQQQPIAGHALQPILKSLYEQQALASQEVNFEHNRMLHHAPILWLLLLAAGLNLGLALPAHAPAPEARAGPVSQQNQIARSGDTLQFEDPTQPGTTLRFVFPNLNEVDSSVLDGNNPHIVVYFARTPPSGAPVFDLSVVPFEAGFSNYGDFLNSVMTSPVQWVRDSSKKVSYPVLVSHVGLGSKVLTFTEHGLLSTSVSETPDKILERRTFSREGIIYKENAQAVLYTVAQNDGKQKSVLEIEGMYDRPGHSPIGMRIPGWGIVRQKIENVNAIEDLQMTSLNERTPTLNRWSVRLGVQYVSAGTLHIACWTYPDADANASFSKPTFNFNADNNKQNTTFVMRSRGNTEIHYFDAQGHFVTYAIPLESLPSAQGIQLTPPEEATGEAELENANASKFYEINGHLVGRKGSHFWVLLDLNAGPDQLLEGHFLNFNRNRADVYPADRIPGADLTVELLFNSASGREKRHIVRSFIGRDWDFHLDLPASDSSVHISQDVIHSLAYGSDEQRIVFSFFFDPKVVLQANPDEIIRQSRTLKKPTIVARNNEQFLIVPGVGPTHKDIQILYLNRGNGRGSVTIERNGVLHFRSRMDGSRVAEFRIPLQRSGYYSYPNLDPAAPLSPARRALQASVQATIPAFQDVKRSYDELKRLPQVKGSARSGQSRGAGNKDIEKVLNVVRSAKADRNVMIELQKKFWRLFPGGGNWLWLFNLLNAYSRWRGHPEMSLRHYSGKRAWWVENVLSYAFAALLIGVSIYTGILPHRLGHSVQFINASAWALFFLLHVRPIARFRRRVDETSRLAPAALISVPMIGVGFLGLSPVLMTVLLTAAGFGLHFIVNMVNLFREDTAAKEAMKEMQGDMKEMGSALKDLEATATDLVRPFNAKHRVTRIRRAIMIERGPLAGKLVGNLDKSGMLQHYFEQSVMRNLEPDEQTLVAEYFHFENLLKRYLEKPNDETTWVYLEPCLVKVSALCEKLSFKFSPHLLEDALREQLEGELSEHDQVYETLMPWLQKIFRGADRFLPEREDENTYTSDEESNNGTVPEPVRMRLSQKFVVLALAFAAIATISRPWAGESVVASWLFVTGALISFHIMPPAFMGFIASLSHEKVRQLQSYNHLRAERLLFGLINIVSSLSTLWLTPRAAFRILYQLDDLIKIPIAARNAAAADLLTNGLGLFIGSAAIIAVLMASDYIKERMDRRRDNRRSGPPPGIGGPGSAGNGIQRSRTELLQAA